MTSQNGGTRYRLVRTLAHGGMAQVYEGVCEGAAGFSRRVAIKRILPTLETEESVRRMFLDEAKIVSRLHHGNIVQVLDYGLLDDSEFIVMEFVDGSDARTACRLGEKVGLPIGVGLACFVVSEVAHALDYLGSLRNEASEVAPVIHRDVSPSNVLLSSSGDVKLSDFGIAFAEKRSERTETGVVKGKLAYMSPEQARAEPLTTASDIYSLGATLHAMLSRSGPPTWFEGKLEVDSELSDEVLSLITWCMQLAPSERPSAEGVAEQAAHIAKQHLAASPKRELMSWLRRTREGQQPARNALDQAMGFFLEPAGEGDAERRYTVTSVAKSPTDPTATTREIEGALNASTRLTSSSSPEILTAASPSSSRGRRSLFVLGSLVPGAIALLLGILQMGDEAPRTLASHDHERERLEPQPEAASAPSSRTVEPEPAVFRAAPSIEEPTAPAQAHHASPNNRAPAQLPAPIPVTVERSLDAPTIGRTDGPATGWLRVGGLSWIGHEVRVDGVSIGHVPLERELPLGTHTISLLAPDGDRSTHSISLVATHTRSTPLRLAGPREDAATSRSNEAEVAVQDSD